MMNRRLLKLITVLFAVIIFGSTVFLSASSKNSNSNEIYNQGSVLKSIEPQHLENPVSWMKELDKIIPPEERTRISKEDPEKLNTTERFVQELFFRVLEEENLKENKVLNLSEAKTDPSLHEDFFTEFIKTELQSVVPQEELFQKNSLNIQKNPNKEDIIKYGNSVGEIIKRNSLSLDHEVTIFKNLIEKRGRQEEINLRELARAYESIAEEASILIIPEDASSFHLNFVNQMKKASLYVEKMSFFQQDPLLAILSFNQYLEDSILSKKSAQEVANYFAQKNIFYQPNEHGAYFTFIRFK